MDHDLACGFAPPYGHQQGLKSQIRCHAGLSGPTNYPAREQVDIDTEIQPAFMGLDVGDIGHQELIRRGRLEPLLQPVLNHDHGFATIPAGAPPIADLRGDPNQ